jgi:predicted HTH transcriptional regulator
MTTEELEELLEAGVETQRIDFKGPCEWDVENVAKDILALSNVQDGGWIIFGVREENNAFVRCGVSPDQKDTFRVDKMRDQMSAFADPHVNFGVEFPKDKQGLEYVAIKVMPFEEVPVICKKNSRETRRATIYYRNMDRRVESGPVSNSYDLRAIIELATVKMMQSKRKLGFSVEPGVKKQLDDELEGL